MRQRYTIYVEKAHHLFVCTFFQRFYPTVFVILFFFLQFLFLYQHTQTIHFNDELEHISGAWEMLHQHKRLYVDISSNHQPLPFLAGYALLKTANPPNLFKLIESARLFLFLISFVGAMYVTLRFKLAGLLSVLLIETIKYHVFGYHLLAESLSVYPILIIGAFLFELIIEKKKLSVWDDIIIGGCLFLSVFSLLPNIPFALICAFLYFLYRPRAFWVRIAPSFLILFLALSFAVNWPAWYEETVKNVSLYFLATETGISSVSKNLFILVFPFLSYMQLNLLIARFYALVFFAGMLAAVFIWRKSRKAPVIFTFGLLYALIILLNLRIQSFNDMGWAGFHLLPQMTLLTSFTAYTMVIYLRQVRLKNIIQWVPLILLSGAILISSPWWFEQRDKLLDHHIQYSTDEVIGNALLFLRHPEDTLLSGPQHGEVNLVAGMPFPGRQITYFTWAFAVPRIRQEIEQVMINQPPTFIYFPETKSPYYNFLQPFLKQQYIQIVEDSGNVTSLYMQKGAITNRTPEEWAVFDSGPFQKPD